MTRKNSDRYHDYLITSLQDSAEAAAYLEVALEEEDFDPALLKKAFVNVLEALGVEHLSSEQLAEYREMTNRLFESANSYTIHEFVNWFNRLGLKLSVVANDQDWSKSTEPALDFVNTSADK